MPKMSEWQNYGGLSVTDNSGAEPVVDATPRKVTAFDTAMPTSAQVTSDPTIDDSIQISDAGDYTVLASFSFIGTQNKIYEFELYNNGAPTGYKVQRKIGTASDAAAAGISGILTMVANGKLTLMQSALNGGTALTMVNAQMKLSRLV